MKQKIVHLNRYHHFTGLMRDTAIKGLLLRYKSDYDISLQSILVLEPACARPERLFFFFHGMDGDCGDGVILRDLVISARAKVVCLGGRGSAWLSDQFLADVGQVIAKYRKPGEKYYLAGVSMGGTQALALPGLLPRSPADGLAGVIALIPGTDLAAIAKSSSNQRVKATLTASIAGNDGLLEKRSPVNLIGNYPKGLPFVIYYNEDDTILLTGPTRKYISRLAKRNPVSVFCSPGEHDFTFTNFDFGAAFSGLGKRSLCGSSPLKEDI